MTLTELKQKKNERIINMVVSDIVCTGLNKLKQEAVDITMNPDAPALAKDWAECFNNINSSSWDEIRSIIKRTL